MSAPTVIYLEQVKFDHATREAREALRSWQLAWWTCVALFPNLAKVHS